MTVANKPDEKIFAGDAPTHEVDTFPDISRGWGITFEQTQGIPPMEWFNFLFKRIDERVLYLLQRGLPEWSETLDYPQGAYIQFNNKTYRSLQANKAKRPDAANSSYWKLWSIDASSLNDYIPNSKKSSAINSTSTDTVATSAAVKTAYDKAVTAQNTANAAIPNSKKSSSVSSTSIDTVATSAAAKTAYDKAVDGVNRANNAQNTANLAILKNNDKTTNNVDNLLGSNRIWSVDNADRNASGFLPEMYTYGVGLAINRGNASQLLYFPHGNQSRNPEFWIKSKYVGHSPSPWTKVAVFDQNYGLNTSGRFYTTSSAGRNSYVSQNTNEAPFYVQTQDSSGQSLYYPFLKGKVSNGTATQFFSFGIETPSRNNQVGDGIIHLISNAGVSQIWRFLDNGDFRALDVITQGNKRLSTAVQISDFSYSKIGDFEIRKFPDGTMIQTFRKNFNDLFGTNSSNQIWGRGEKSLTWPVAFVDNPIVFGNITTSITYGHDAGTGILTKSSRTKLYWANYEHGSDNQGASSITFLAIGRWK